jgi:hypothetical protein
LLSDEDLVRAGFGRLAESFLADGGESLSEAGEWSRTIGVGVLPVPYIAAGEPPEDEFRARLAGGARRSSRRSVVGGTKAFGLGPAARGSSLEEGGLMTEEVEAFAFGGCWGGC